jgi:hypothetical protein
MFGDEVQHASGVQQTLATKQLCIAARPVMVDNSRTRHVIDAPSRFSNPPAQIYVLAIEREPFVEHFRARDRLTTY